MILQTHLLNIVKYLLGKYYISLVHIKTKSAKQLAKELRLHRNTGRYHKRIHEFLFENHC